MQFQSKYARSVLHGGARLNTCIKYLTIDNQACKALGKSAQLDPAIRLYRLKLSPASMYGVTSESLYP